MDSHRKMKLRNWGKRVFGNIPKHTYLFILAPPYSGSTLLTEIICSSKNVSINNTLNTREGQSLPEVRKLLFDHPRKWDPEYQPHWPTIKMIWSKYWDLTKPILLEKSPPNLIRAEKISKYFSPVYFICLVRNPFALAQSEYTRHPDSAINLIAERIITRFHKLAQLQETLQNFLLIRYEDLTENSTASLIRLQEFMPELGKIEANGLFNAHNFKKEKLPITNLNSEKIASISPKVLSQLKQCFSDHKELFQMTFGYSV